MRPLCWRNLKTNWKRFHGDQSGIALIYVTVALPVLIGFSLLAIDVGRLSSLQSSLQHGADALALAGAGELDRRTDAIERANGAIANLITTNTSLFATSVVTIDENSIATPCFLSSLPASDATPIDPLNCLPVSNATEIEASSVSARFVQVIVTPQNFNTIFPVTFLGGASNSAQSSAEAVAGFDAAVCKFTPLFMCNPFEPSGNTDIMRTTELFAHLSTRANRRRLVELLRSAQGGQGQSCGPGNFGLIQTDTLDTFPEIRIALASSNPETCLIQNNIETKTGNPAQSEPVSAALNSRFDMYPQGNNFPNKNNVNYRPAKNVRKGYVPGGTGANACPFVDADPSQAMALPRDGCFDPAVGGCGGNAGPVGTGDWGGTDTSPDFEQYWAQMGGVSAPTAPNDSEPGAGQTYSNSNLPTRYDIYKYEIEHNNGALLNVPSTGGEVGTPACYTGGVNTITVEPDRRIIYGAIVNCTAYTAQNINACNGHSNLQAVAFGKFFVTEPVAPDNATPPVEHLFTEFIGLVEPGTANSVARDIVQLYR